MTKTIMKSLIVMLAIIALAVSCNQPLNPIQSVDASAAKLIATPTPVLYGITISYAEPVHGTVEFDPPGGQYAPGTAVTITGVGYRNMTEEVSFIGWEGNVNSMDNPITVVMDGPKFIVAHFKRTILPEYPEWELNATYELDDIVLYNGVQYKCLIGHTAYAENWNPESAPSLWVSLF